MTFSHTSRISWQLDMLIPIKLEQQKVQGITKHCPHISVIDINRYARKLLFFYFSSCSTFPLPKNIWEFICIVKIFNLVINETRQRNRNREHVGIRNRGNLLRRKISFNILYWHINYQWWKFSWDKRIYI